MQVAGAGRASVLAVSPGEEFPLGAVTIMVPDKENPTSIHASTPELRDAIEAGATAPELAERVIDFLKLEFE